jgi:hypothetical protein
VNQQTDVRNADAARDHMPAQEKEQPDPMLQITTHRGGGVGAALLTVAAILVLWVVLYGLNEPGATSTAPPANGPAAASEAASPTAPQNGPHNSGSGTPAVQ